MGGSAPCWDIGAHGRKVVADNMPLHSKHYHSTDGQGNLLEDTNMMARSLVQLSTDPMCMQSFCEEKTTSSLLFTQFEGHGVQVLGYDSKTAHISSEGQVKIQDAKKLLDMCNLRIEYDQRSREQTYKKTVDGMADSIVNMLANGSSGWAAGPYRLELGYHMAPMPNPPTMRARLQSTCQEHVRRISWFDKSQLMWVSTSACWDVFTEVINQWAIYIVKFVEVCRQVKQANGKLPHRHLLEGL
eukprot:347270-Chlamydomonas_euryale.AAC.1